MSVGFDVTEQVIIIYCAFDIYLISSLFWDVTQRYLVDSY